MGRGRVATAVCLAAVGALLAAAPAHGAKSCGEPGASWERATPAEAGMDAAKLQSALDYGSSQASFAVRVYRHGCLVGEDRAAAQNRNERYESWSMAKSVTALLFGRAMTMREIGPDDPVGSLIPEADGPHGAITMRNLLEMTSGLKWNGFRDYNIFTMPDRVRDALTLGVDHPPGTYYEYAQSSVTLLAEAVGQSMGEDVRAFAQKQLMSDLGIANKDWNWNRDPAGHVQGFCCVQMRPDDYGRLGELLRRGGVWQGKRLLTQDFVREALTPSRNNGCYGWLIWLNGGAPCVGPTIGSRPVSQSREYPALPADMWHFSGLFGQLVTVFPTQGLMIVRTGQDPGLVAGVAGGQDGGPWEQELYTRTLGAITDQSVTPGGDPPASSRQQDSDYGFQTALGEPDQYRKGLSQDPLPPAGPGRARAPQVELVRERASRRGVMTFRLWCPTRWRGPGVPAGCRGRANATGAPKATRYAVAPGKYRFIRFKLTRKRQRSLLRKGRMKVNLTAVNADSAGGASARLATTVRRPLKVAKPKKKAKKKTRRKRARR